MYRCFFKMKNIILFCMIFFTANYHNLNSGGCCSTDRGSFGLNEDLIEQPVEQDERVTTEEELFFKDSILKTKVQFLILCFTVLLKDNIQKNEKDRILKLTLNNISLLNLLLDNCNSNTNLLIKLASILVEFRDNIVSLLNVRYLSGNIKLTEILSRMESEEIYNEETIYTKDGVIKILEYHVDLLYFLFRGLEFLTIGIENSDENPAWVYLKSIAGEEYINSFKFHKNILLNAFFKFFIQILHEKFDSKRSPLPGKVIFDRIYFSILAELQK